MLATQLSDKELSELEKQLSRIHERDVRDARGENSKAKLQAENV